MGVTTSSNSAQTYEPIATSTLGSAQATVTFSSIVGTYRDLVLIINSTPTTSNVTGNMRFNSDTGVNYYMTGMRGNGTNTA